MDPLSSVVLWFLEVVVVMSFFVIFVQREEINKPEEALAKNPSSVQISS